MVPDARQAWASDRDGMVFCGDDVDGSGERMPEPRWATRLRDVHEAIRTLRVASLADEDPQRFDVADVMERRFANIADARALRQNAREALTLWWRGGMGSFQDTGSAIMSRAVDGLRDALRMAKRRW